MKLNTFFNHDTDEQIIQKRTSEELNLWVSHINYIINESDKLSKIASNIYKNKQFRDRFLELIIKYQSVLNQLRSYKNTMVNYKECDDFECDLFYINKHEDFRKKYLETVSEYRENKNKLYLKILT